jgi:PilZ domain
MMMELSSEVFRQIVGQLKMVAGKSGKRGEPRVGLRNRVLFAPLKGKDHEPDSPRYVAIRDLSADGIGLLLNHKLPLKSLFAIRLPATESDDLVAIYVVKHCEILEDDHLYRVGGSLTQLFDPEATAKPAPTAAAAVLAKDAPAPKPTAAALVAPAA